MLSEYVEMEDDILIAINRFQNGDETEVFGTAAVKYSELKTEEVFNRYRFLELPIWLGYRYSFGQKSALKFELGFSTSILSRHSGKGYSEEMLIPLEDLPNHKAKQFGFLRALYGLHYDYV